MSQLPSQSSGACAFSVETGEDAGRRVTDHAASKSDDGPRAGYLDERSESLRNAVRAAVGQTDRITVYQPLGPTDYQRAILEGLSHAP